MKRQDIFRFRLYIAGDTENSTRALTNLNALCAAHLPEAYEIEVVDVFRDPQRALEDSVFMTPTLIKLGPLPVRKIVGTLSQTDAVLESLGLLTVRV